jgi:hypothetical protein
MNKQFYFDIPVLDNARIEMGEYIDGVIQGPYRIENINENIYIICNDKKYLVLYYESIICILIDCANNDTFFGLNKNSKYVYSYEDPRRPPFIGIRDGWPIKTSSYLTETIAGKEVVYNGIPNYFLELTRPWVEGKEGHGIGEWIEINMASPIDEIVFLNGYIDPNRPDLYSANSRAKEIQISVDDESWTYTIMDTANPQILKLPRLVTGNIRFTIKDVYPGTKYTDTCIAGIYFLGVRGQ